MVHMGRPALYKSAALALLLAVLLTIFAPCALAYEQEYQPFGEADLKCALLVDDDTGEVLFEQNAYEVSYPASTTKMLTALMVIEAVEQGKIGFDDVIVLQRKLVDSVMWDASHVSPRVKADEKLTVEQLLHCVMIESDCAACNILADYVAGSVDAFVQQMNSRAVALGCTDTNFVNTHGYPNDNHYTTAYSLYLIASEAMKHPDFARIVSTKEYIIPKTNLTRQRTLRNTNWLLGMPSDISESDIKYDTDYYYEYCVGIKTGYASAAGSCLASCAKKDGRTLICIVLGAEGMTLPDGTTRRRSFYESRRLLQWGFDNFSRQTYITTSDIVGQMPVRGGGRIESVGLRPVSSADAMLPNGMDYTDLESELLLKMDSVAAPVYSGMELGELKLYRNENLIATLKLVASEDVAEASTLDLIVLRLFGKDTTTALMTVNLVMLVIAGLWALILGMRRANRRGEAQVEASLARPLAQPLTGREPPRRTRQPQYYSDYDPYYEEEQYTYDRQQPREPQYAQYGSQSRPLQPLGSRSHGDDYDNYPRRW